MPVLLAFCAAIGLLGGGAAPAPAMVCRNTDTRAMDQALEDFNASVFCLINQQRASHGRSRLRPNATLQRAAHAYATSMAAGGFFSHYGDFLGHPAGATPISRLREVGYIRPGRPWIVGENLHWTTVEQSRPADVVGAWMGSFGHRKYLLKGKFRELGVAAIRGVPGAPSRSDGVIVASEYGFRTR
jgi:uncharacterized protein YkwD